MASRGAVSALLGWWLCWHYRRRARQVGTLKAAQQMRKQGVPWQIARLVIGDKLRGPQWLVMLDATEKAIRRVAQAIKNQ